MGTIKGKKIELATAQQVTADLQDANKYYDLSLKQIRAGATDARTAVSKYSSVVKDCEVIISKAKEIGADTVVKDVTETMGIAKKNLKLAQDAADAGNI